MDSQLPDLTNALNMAQAAKRMRGRGGKAPSVETLRRWANPRRGCRPQGKAGPVLVLRTVRLNGVIVTLPEWVDAFERERVRLGMRSGGLS